MKVIKVLNVHEDVLERIEKDLIVTRDHFELDSPMRAMVQESLTKFLQAKKLNRTDQQKPQMTYRYVVESTKPLFTEEDPVEHRIEARIFNPAKRAYEPVDKYEYPSEDTMVR